MAEKRWKVIPDEEGSKRALDSKWGISFWRPELGGRIDAFFTDDVRFDNGFIRFRPKVMRELGVQWLEPEGITEVALSGPIRAEDPEKLIPKVDVGASAPNSDLAKTILAAIIESRL